MTDKQMDKLNEIKSIASLMQVMNTRDNLDGDTIQRIGEQIMTKCMEIEFCEQ